MNSKQSNKQTMLPGSSLVLLVALAGLVMVLLPVGTVPAVHAQQSDRAGALIEPNDALYDARYARIAKEKRESSRRPTSAAEDHESEEFYGLPIEYALQLSELNTSADILPLLDPDSVDSRIFMDGGEYSGRDIGMEPVAASCEPDSELVSLRPENLTSSRYYYYPSCTRVKRCSGCCNTKQLVCEPTANRTILYKVTILEYRPNKKDRFSHRELVPIEEHVRCKCQCRVKAWHCNERQQYNANNCRCECTNRADRDECALESDRKQWNPSTCTCDCLPRNEDCTSGSHYDRNACKCVPNDFYAYDGVASYWDHQKQQQEQQEQQQQQQRPIPLTG
ncbi:uncharacterized protein LOC121588643 isoform X2 [Anopheles merus]|uniref:Platelet-derived growth factor (PDGF) family profile domain-containing protein n=1 Tax=Anopheles merus TaxID=30066 RepID=A0A9I3M3U2_ANOME|nr:uncharacterized protein LOC121588643 isoform X2 [Anopheles merus]XP_041762756.1 uncharacterized protein LOC121588643 isoform X2 [Anopheles merus]XP_041762767.1 uncharacterized protein LOC121588643 isoform X2 [Anopheles merus]XP_041762777.1 uncharacterized protein LOC121588643 isoform X2 [Anopheles merus]XP_041762785.1 uncharacterized protein LOC121588643 isoform X2 [Anopheles merus]XP_041762794.1 uncharacterized protein LOC121588643 isoform X2 [Anopheles merus]XP_041762802.1 uncharacterize